MRVYGLSAEGTGSSALEYIKTLSADAVVHLANDHWSMALSVVRGKTDLALTNAIFEGLFNLIHSSCHITSMFPIHFNSYI